MKKTFHLSDILTISTGIFVCQRGIEGIYDILNFMTQDNLMTHQLIPAGYIMETEIKRQLPFLVDIIVPNGGLDAAEKCTAWVQGVATAVGGEIHGVTAAPHLWQGHDPVSDYGDIIDGKYRKS